MTIKISPQYVINFQIKKHKFRLYVKDFMQIIKDLNIDLDTRFNLKNKIALQVFVDPERILIFTITKNETKQILKRAKQFIPVRYESMIRVSAYYNPDENKYETASYKQFDYYNREIKNNTTIYDDLEFENNSKRRK